MSLSNPLLGQANPFIAPSPIVGAGVQLKNVCKHTLDFITSLYDTMHVYKSGYRMLDEQILSFQNALLGPVSISGSPFKKCTLKSHTYNP